MSAEKVPHTGQWIREWPFVVGLILIGLATLLNVGFDAMSGARKGSVPYRVAAAYEKIGKTGVTFALVGLGGLVIAGGCVLQARRAAAAEQDRRSRPALRDFDDTQSVSSSVRLETSKYLGRTGAFVEGAADPVPEPELRETA